MATPNQPSARSTVKPQTVKPTNGGAKHAEATAAPTTEAPKPAKPKRQKVRLVSTTTPGLWVRAYADVINQFGRPLDPKGVPMEVGVTPRFGTSPETRAAMKAEKEAEKARLEAMSEEEKLAYVAKKREEKQAKILAKRAAEKARLIAEVKAELKAQGLLKESEPTAA